MQQLLVILLFHDNIPQLTYFCDMLYMYLPTIYASFIAHW